MNNLLQHIVNTGCSSATDEDQQRTIRIVNTLCLTTAVMSLLFSTCCYFLSGEMKIVLPAFIESLLFLFVIGLNGWGMYTLAAVSMIAINNITIQYYSAILGRVTEVHLLFIFLLGLSMLIFKTRSLRKLGIVITCLSFFAGEINLYNGFIEPIVSIGDRSAAQFVIRWVTIPSILLLDIIVINYYFRNIDRLRKREREHMQTLLDTARQHNEELQELTAKLEKATNAKTIFVRETSHEIRTPLNAIFGISQLLQLKVKQDRSLAPIGLLADHLYAASYNTREVINNVLEFSRIEAGKLDIPQPSSFNVREWIEVVVNIHRYVANAKQVDIYHRVADDTPLQVIGDKMMLTKMINNLLSNAIKFTLPGSAVDLHISATNQEWYITVTDQGAGISEDKQATIFDAFVTERNIFLEGTGLGLHITRHLAELQGGSIDVYSKRGIGTTFTVCLPLKVVSAGSPQSMIVRAEELINLNATTILIIEDDKMSQLVLSHFLTGLGSRVILAEDGVQGILLAKAAKPDIIILDSHMPGMSGKETLTHIREDEMLKNVPVIVSSGDAFNEACEEMLQAGASEYLIKPIEFKMLYSAVCKYAHAPQLTQISE